jgi:hypothetical protein
VSIWEGDKLTREKGRGGKTHDSFGFWRRSLGRLSSSTSSDGLGDEGVEGGDNGPVEGESEEPLESWFLGIELVDDVLKR